MNNNVAIRKYEEKDIFSMITIWNEVVEEGIAFPQLDLLNDTTGPAFFASQTYCGVAEGSISEACPADNILGLYRQMWPYM